MKPMKAEIGLFSGRMIDLLKPNPEDISIRDIAHHLSGVCRFSGACQPWYSVARHSLLVASLCSPRNRVIGLLHDATEAYLGDVSTPLKAVLPEYQAIETTLHAVIMDAFGYQRILPGEVHNADRAAFLAEWEFFMPSGLDHGLNHDHYVPDMLAEAIDYLDRAFGDKDLWKEPALLSARGDTSKVSLAFERKFHEYAELRRKIIAGDAGRESSASRAARVAAGTAGQKPQCQSSSLQLESD